MIWGNNLSIGNGSLIYTVDTMVDCHLGHLKIGDNTRILDGVKIWTHEHQWQPFLEEEIPTDLEIGSNCIIGAYAMILPGCNKIVDDVVIGAGAVVAKNITESGTYVGNPIRKIK